MNYLWPLFRGLARTIEAGSNSGQATVIQAKKKIGYARGDLDILSKGGNPKGTKQNFKAAYDIYYDWIVSRDNKTVKALTGKDQRFWTDFERRLEKTTEESKGTMNFTSINHALTQAINNLAEGEIDVAALAMAEDIEREKLDEAKRTKKEQQRIDGRSLKKYGMKWRSTPSGAVIGLTRKGKVVAGNPDLLKSLPKEKLSRKAKETMAAVKDEAPQKAKKTRAINKMLSGKKKSPADKLRDDLAKAKKMGKSFEDMGETDDISETSDKINFLDMLQNPGKYPEPPPDPQDAPVTLHKYMDKYTIKAIVDYMKVQRSPAKKHVINLAQLVLKKKPVPLDLIRAAMKALPHKGGSFEDYDLGNKEDMKDFYEALVRGLRDAARR